MAEIFKRSSYQFRSVLGGGAMGIVYEGLGQILRCLFPERCLAYTALDFSDRPRKIRLLFRREQLIQDKKLGTWNLK